MNYNSINDLVKYYFFLKEKLRLGYDSEDVKTVVNVINKTPFDDVKVKFWGLVSHYHDFIFEIHGSVSTELTKAAVSIGSLRSKTLPFEIELKEELIKMVGIDCDSIDDVVDFYFYLKERLPTGFDEKNVRTTVGIINETSFFDAKAVFWNLASKHSDFFAIVKTKTEKEINNIVNGKFFAPYAKEYLLKPEKYLHFVNQSNPVLQKIYFKEDQERNGFSIGK